MNDPVSPAVAGYTIVRNNDGELEWAKGQLCTCCLGITGRPQTPAVYEWTGRNGNRSYLCVSCCAHWRKNAVDDPSLLPREIHELQEWKP